MTRYYLLPSSFALMATALGTLVLGGCNLQDLAATMPGQYHGTLVTKHGAVVEQGPNLTTVSMKSKGVLELNSQPENGGFPVLFLIQAERAGEVTLTLENWSNSSETKLLLKPSSSNCVATAPSGEASSIFAVLCLTGTDLSVDVNWGPGLDALTLSVSRVDPSIHPVFERSSKSYSVSELFQQALNQNFDSVIEFQRVVQAKLNTETDYLNLIPHLSVNSVLNIAALNNLGYLKAVGDIVPFLFPTRWLEAREAKYRSEGEFDAWILSKADAASLVEGLSESVARDEQILSVINDNESFIVGVRDQIREREQTGLMQAGASDDVESILNAIEEGKEALISNVQAAKASLAEAVGMDYYDAVSDVKLPDLPSLDHMMPYEKEAILKLQDVAIDRSYELRQMSSLIQVSRLQHTASYFQWLDPSGDREGGLGFDLFTYEKISAARTQELIAKREKLEAGILEKVAITAGRANESLKSYQLTSTGVEIQTRRIQRHLSNMRTGIAFSMSDLTNALQEKLKAQIGLLQSQYSYLIVQGNINRLLLAGPYSNLPTDRGEPGWVIKAN